MLRIKDYINKLVKAIAGVDVNEIIALNERLNSQLHVLQNEKNALSVNLYSIQKNNDLLLKQIENDQSIILDKDNLISALQQKNAALEKDCEKLRLDNSSIKTDNDDLEKKFALAENRLANITEQKEFDEKQYVAKLANTQRLLDETTETLKQITEEFSTLRKEKEEAEVVSAKIQNDLRDQLEAIKESVESKDNELRNTLENAGRFTAEIERLKEEKGELYTENKELEARNEELETNASKLNNDISALNSALEESNNKIENAEARIAELENEMSAEQNSQSHEEPQDDADILEP